MVSIHVLLSGKIFVPGIEYDMAVGPTWPVVYMGRLAEPLVCTVI